MLSSMVWPGELGARRHRKAPLVSSGSGVVAFNTIRAKRVSEPESAVSRLRGDYILLSGWHGRGPESFRFVLKVLSFSMFSGPENLVAIFVLQQRPPGLR